MQYTQQFNLNMPEETDRIRVDDFNENAQVVDEVLGLIAPNRAGVDGEMLVCGSSGPTWSPHLYQAELIGEEIINLSGALTQGETTESYNYNVVAQLPTGWDTTDVTAIWAEVNLQGVDIVNTSASKVLCLAFGTQPLSRGIIYSTARSYAYTGKVGCSVTGSIDGLIYVGTRGIGDTAAWDSVDWTGTLEVDDAGIVTAVGACYIGFKPANGYYYTLSTTSLTGTVKFYAVKELLI